MNENGLGERGMLRGSTEEKKAGSAVKICGVHGEWRKREKTGCFKGSVAKMGTRLGDWNWRTGKRVKSI